MLVGMRLATDLREDAVSFRNIPKLENSRSMTHWIIRMEHIAKISLGWGPRSVLSRG